jgi:dipeptidyl aminopeptidase/acylaminoacyl peptidase
MTNGFGRENHLTFRILTDQRDPLHLKEIKNLTLATYHNLEKSDGIYTLKKAGQNPEKVLHENKKWDFAAKAKLTKHWLFTREDYHEYPDFYLFEEGKWNKPTRLTDLHPDVAEYNWGCSELVEWKSMDGTDMQGVVIKPENFEEGKQYPVLVYYYRFFSQRLHEFNMPRINHRPAFPLWASDGYLIFLPDIRFEVGRPGLASTKSLVPGVQKLIELGWADPDAIGLHGHSWSGYQTAMMITHTDIFKAAIAGAPVSNMTSAYGGIRWGSGLSRAFQYEKTQSRLGVSMWEDLQPYIENSPLFFADQINTPLLFIHGDVDGAVPWYQSIELYVALRRLGKEAVFLQYHGEDHHPATYPNKLDWAMKMKQYFDHYLKGKAAEAWIKEGVRYEGK